MKQATPGDIVMVQGILLTKKRNNGYDSDLSFNLQLVACKITREKKKYVEMNINEERMAEIQNVRANFTEDEIY